MSYTKVSKLASQVFNNVNSGLQGIHTNDSMSLELLEDSVVQERLQVMKEYSLKGILPLRDLYISINCVPVDCKDLERCRCNSEVSDGCENTPTAHFEIPQLLNDYGAVSIDYIGSTDRQNPFLYSTSATLFRQRKYRKRGKSKPYVWIDTTPNENGMYDCFIFNAPLINTVSITAIFKDLRQLEGYGCCDNSSDDNLSFIDNEVVKRCTEKMIRWYRQLAQIVEPNTQAYDEG